MKTKIQHTWLLAACLFCTTYGIAQVKEKEAPKTVRFKWVEEKNGQRKEVDTVLQVGKDFNEKAFFLSLGLDTSHIPSITLSEDTKNILQQQKQTIINEEKEIEIDKTGEKQKMVIIRSDNPEEINQELELLGLGKETDSLIKKMMVITDDVKEGEDIQVIEHNDGNKKSRIVLHRIVIKTLDQNEQLPAKKLQSNGKLKVEQMNLYPNPTSGRFKLSFELPDKGNTEILVMDASGKTVFQENLKNFSGHYEKEIDLSAEAKGIYYVKVQQGKQSISNKISFQ